MSRILISILSNHNIPNFLFIKEMKGNYDELGFIITKEVERDGRDRQIESALKLEPGTTPFITVDGNDYRQALMDIAAHWDVRERDKYLVNLTGGTKMMSLAVHDFFLKFDTKFFYVPIGENIYYDMQTGEKTPIAYRSTLKEYLLLYGINYIESNALTYQATDTFSLFNTVKQQNFKPTWEMRKSQKAASPEGRYYYGGGWFEDYTYLRIKKQFGLSDDAIAKNMKLYRSNKDKENDNELDVAFMLDNQLYVIECKVSMTGWGVSSKENIESILYKIAAISRDFGLKVNSYIFTLHNFTRLAEKSVESIKKRSSILNVKIIGQDALSQKKLQL